MGSYLALTTATENGVEHEARERNTQCADRHSYFGDQGNAALGTLYRLDQCSIVTNVVLRPTYNGRYLKSRGKWKLRRDTSNSLQETLRKGVRCAGVPDTWLAFITIDIGGITYQGRLLMPGFGGAIAMTSAACKPIPKH